MLNEKICSTIFLAQIEWHNLIAKTDLLQLKDLKRIHMSHIKAANRTQYARSKHHGKSFEYYYSFRG